MIEEVDIGISNLDVVQIPEFSSPSAPPSPRESSGGGGGGGSSVNFGGGIEMLMNEKRKSTTKNGAASSSKMSLGDIDQLENELNELAGVKSSSSSSSGGGGPSSFFEDISQSVTSLTSNLFGGQAAAATTTTSSSSSSGTSSDSSGGGGGGGGGGVGQHAKESLVTSNANRTWDGFMKINEVPMSATPSGAPKMTEMERRRKKRAMIKKLDEWHEKGVLKHNSHFTMDSDFDEVEDEYESALDDKRKKDSVKLQGWWFMTFVNSLEYANTVFNPFDLNLDGWGEQISEDIDSYDDIFVELHDKYKGGKISPEISLLLRLGFSAAVINITNKALSTATPGFNDVIKQSPELMKMFTNATVQSMNKESQGISMVSNMINGGGGGGGNGGNGGGGGMSSLLDNSMSTLFGPPPKPVETKTDSKNYRADFQFRQQPQQMPMSNRPDLDMGRGGGGGGGGVGSTTTSRQQLMGANSRQEVGMRQEMRGPQKTDLDSILSGLKPTASPQQDIFNSGGGDFDILDDDNVSVLSGGGGGGGGGGANYRGSGGGGGKGSAAAAAKPPRRPAKKSSDRNVVSLDL